MTTTKSDSRVLMLFRSRERLALALERKRTTKWCLTLWSRYIRERDKFRCVLCESEDQIQAHHIFRRTTFSIGTFELGNGITLCATCHGKVHEDANGKFDASKPLGWGGADDQDEAAFLYGLLVDDAKAQGLDQNEFYHLSDEILQLFVRVQGYESVLKLALRGEISRVRAAHEMWHGMPEDFYVTLANSLFSDLEVHLSTSLNGD